MRPLFTIHAGEFLVADYIERNYTKSHHLRVWIPSKDDGIDLLVTDQDCKHSVTLQVKFSKNFDCERQYDASGWWLLDKGKIETSQADYWVFALPKFLGKRTFSDCCYFLIKPSVLLKRMTQIHGRLKAYNMYLTVKSKTAIETRGMRKLERENLFIKPEGARDFSEFLDSWDVALNGILK